MPGRRLTLRMGRLAGIPVGVHPLWLIIVALITLALGSDYFPSEVPGISDTGAYLLGLASALAVFAGILLHELGHAVVARRHGVEIEEIDLWLLGGVARMAGEPRAAGDELRFALAGPAVTAVLLAGFGALRLAIGGAPAALRAFLDYQVYVSAAILVFNLLPAFPLDGGRVVRALLWRRLGDREQATALAARSGRVFGFVLMALGIVSFASGAVGGLWLALVGGFIVVAAAAEAQRATVEREFAGRIAATVMTAPAVTLSAHLSLRDAVVVGFSRHLFSAFPVVGPDGRALGVLTIDDVRLVPPGERAQRSVGEVACLDPALLVTPETPVTELLARPAFLRTGRVVVVGAGGQPVGIVSVTDIERRMRADALLPQAPPQRRAA
jgi:Zn-dependent protease/CBS domain-containing protein